VKYYEVCPIGVIGGKQDALTYSSNQELDIGAIVVIPFGSRTKVGVVLRQVIKPKFQTKPITKTLPDSLPEHLLELAFWMRDYYATRLPFVLQTIVPSGVSKARRKTNKQTALTTQRSNTQFILTDEQSKATLSIKNSNATTHILHGITGSGKTRVYQELAQHVLEKGQSVLILVPEIALTPQLAAEFQSLHNDVLIQHSRQTESERHKNWQTLRQTSNPWVVVGPRSALFSPLCNIGLVVVDESHEPSYQQDSQPKYNALRVARKLVDLSPVTAKLVLGSATPSVSDYYLATKTGAPIHKLIKPTRERNTTIEVVDIKDRSLFGTHPLFSRSLLDAMNNAVAQNEQILLFHNRRGTARTALCSNCGWSAQCKNCHIPMRLHHDTNVLQCHTCGLIESIPKLCPKCSTPDIEFKGFGSKRIETEVKKLFPKLWIARFDSDTIADEQLQNRYQDLYDNKINIIIGTQTIAKGLDLPSLSTVGVIQADSELFIPDYSSSERSFQLTTQVIGRAGRQGQASSVIIQTLNPDHPAITHAIAQNYNDFYTYEIAERQAEHMPPYTFMMQLTCGYSTQHGAQTAAKKRADMIRREHPGIFVRGPAPAFHEHRGSLHYQQLIVSSHDRTKLVTIVRSLPSRWQFKLDPINLL